MSLPALALLVAAIIAGGTSQRVSGMGMGLILAPVLSLILGAAVGVTVTNVTTVCTALVIGFVLRAGIDWKKFAIIAPSALLGTIPGGLVVAYMDGAWLSVLVGALILLALAITLWANRQQHLPHLTHPAWIIPFAAGGAFMNATAGVVAPVLMIYAIASRWDHRSFSATLQPTFAWIGGLSIIVKVSLGATPIDSLPDWWVLLVILAAIPTSVLLGTLVSRHVSTQTAKKIALAVATLGAVSTLLRGLIDALG
ncbi:sulfite exporter TauE/SafE family protein [Flaviflexus equikiangi]|uniref:Probable membrane transporter protein n=1 Tax=Flaviflexus equikiangi TaxID=2758573 RepID=A0ABS2TFE6_9ACTO|nr:sulfite exporter TauE/SafE family protein [Flaviflexus equikiangi]MBM9433375.1 sulfite exporter TauE/SafE family protein [Flaviflexus equikiangi]